MTSVSPVDRVIAALTARGSEPRANGDTAWTARCPAHDDNDPSLSIGLGSEGKVLLTCHAGCELGAILTALHLEQRDLFPDTNNGHAPTEQRRIVARYPYVDEAGELLYEVVRYQPKDFRQRRPDGNGGWHWNLQDTRRVLYRLPEVLAAVENRQLVWITEGEKDADALQAVLPNGEIATCNPQGAGKWRPEYSQSLKGAGVIIWSDADEIGRRHAREVAASLLGQAVAIRIVESPRLKDPADHLGAGLTILDIVDVTTAPLEAPAPTTEPPAPASDPDPTTDPRLPDPIDWAEFWNRERRTEEWAIPQIVPAGRLVTIWASKKTGKSLLTLDIAAAAASGQSILGQPAADPLEVIYLDMEMTEDDLEERLVDLGYRHGDDLSKLHYYLLPSLPPLDDYAGGDVLCALVERHQAQLVIIDTMARAVAGKENDADTYRAFYRCTGIRLKQAGVSCLRLDHAGKEKDRGERGSSAKGDDVDLSWELRTAGGNEYLLKKSYSRISWVAEQIKLRRETDPRLRHRISADNWPAGTGPTADHLDRLQAPDDITVNAAVALLRDDEVSPRGRQMVAAALRWRRHPDRLLAPARKGME